MRTARQISAQAKKLRKSAIDKPISLPKAIPDDCDSDDIDDMMDRVLRQFFIDRDGVIQRYTGSLKDRDVVSMHYRIAADLFPDITYPQSPDDHVCKILGWVLIGSTVYTTPICYKKPTAAQLKTLQDLGDWYIKGLCFPYKGSMIKYSQYGALCD
jgi:hypothetical protein